MNDHRQTMSNVYVLYPSGIYIDVTPYLSFRRWNLKLEHNLWFKTDKNIFQFSLISDSIKKSDYLGFAPVNIIFVRKLIYAIIASFSRFTTNVKFEKTVDIIPYTSISLRTTLNILKHIYLSKKIEHDI